MQLRAAAQGLEAASELVGPQVEGFEVLHVLQRAQLPREAVGAQIELHEQSAVLEVIEGAGELVVRQIELEQLLAEGKRLQVLHTAAP